MTDAPAATGAPPDRTAPAAHPIAPLLASRWSPRSYLDREVPEEMLRRLLEAARWAPSCYNAQPWHYVIARRHREPEAFAALLDCLSSGNRTWCARAPVLMISVARMDFPQNGSPNRHAWHDLGAASTLLALEAAALGLQAHQMAGFDAAKARAACAVPEGYEPVAAIALGHPGSPDALAEPYRTRETSPRIRRPIEEFGFLGRWGEAL
jgi:nitroreductase